RVSGHIIGVDPHKVGRIGGIQGAVPVTPTHENLGFGGRRISAPVTISRAFHTPRFAQNRAIAARTPFDQQQRAVSQALRVNAGRMNAPVTHDNTLRGNGGRDNAPVTRENRQNVSGSWARFNQDRGNSVAGRANQPNVPRSFDGNRSGNVESARNGNNFDGGRASGFGRSEAGGGRQDNAPGDSWSRFSRDRGSVTGSYNRSGNSGASYGRGGVNGSVNGSYNRNSYPSYARPSNPSYARGSYDRGGYGSAYDRGGYGNTYGRGSGSYNRSAYPSYARPSNPSYSRGSYSSAPR